MMKIKTLVIGLALVAALMMVTACSSKEPSGQSTAAKETPAQPAAAQQESQPAAEANQAAQAQPAEQAAQPAAETAQQADQKGQTLAITGMVEQSDSGIVIATGMGKYLVNGQDLSNLIGKTVNVTGTVQEAMGTYTIDVISVEQAE